MKKDSWVLHFVLWLKLLNCYLTLPGTQFVKTNVFMASGCPSCLHDLFTGKVTFPMTRYVYLKIENEKCLLYDGDVHLQLSQNYRRYLPEVLCCGIGHEATPVNLSTLLSSLCSNLNISLRVKVFSIALEF